MQRELIGTTARTGEQCPESGLWKLADTPAVLIRFAKGETLPPYDGRPVIWQLARYA
jgi:hypothetical protein